jgi:SAM-dependent methyltransferase
VTGVQTCALPIYEKYITIQDTIPSEEQLFDAIFTACVFHHISHDFHEKWLKELFRVIKPGGVLAVYEHNPLNPLTVRAVNTCPIDVNARLIRAGNMKKLLIDCGWRDVRVEYKVFFPSVLKHLRFLEKRMNVLPLGAQYRLTAIR